MDHLVEVPILETDRLKLIDLDPDTNAAEINASVLDSFETLHTFLLFTEKRPTVEDTRVAFQKMREERLKGLSCCFGIFLKEHQQFVGTCGAVSLKSPTGDRIRDQIDPSAFENPWLLGYWINHRYEGHGYVTEACTVLIDYCTRKFGVDAFLSDINPKNEKSRKVVARLGFEILIHDAVMKNDGIRSDWPAEVPCIIYFKRTGERKVITETERLKLVEIDPETESVEFHALILDTFDSLHPWVPWAEKPPTVEDIRGTLKRVQENRGKFSLFMGIFSKENYKIIGTCGLMNLRGPRGERVRDQIDSPEYKNPWLIGYWLHKRYEGRGYITEACKSMMDYSVQEMGVDCFFAEIDPRNGKSAGVVKRLGFEYFIEIMQKNGGIRSDWPEESLSHIYRKKI